MSVRVLAVPDTDGEHADEALYRCLDAEGGERLQHHFGVGMAAKADAACFEFGAQFLEIVNFAIVRDDHPAI